ncbi:unnamed protein product [Toxocara canis]|uniref:Polyprotein n=1 Tax=Toxocara canis TaxID=6265 RepID=A0A183UPM8_TOXCA|nr:unnamed protein product [Toxocara canis]
MDAHNGYPDMNVIFFKGIPKLMQVADDMHRMADCVSDFRTLTYGAIVVSIIGSIAFLVMKFTNKRGKQTSHRNAPHHFQRMGGCQTYPWRDVNGRGGVVRGAESPSIVSTQASECADMDCETVRNNNNAYYKDGPTNVVVE